MGNRHNIPGLAEVVSVVQYGGSPGYAYVYRRESGRLCSQEDFEALIFVLRGSQRNLSPSQGCKVIQGSCFAHITGAGMMVCSHIQIAHSTKKLHENPFFLKCLYNIEKLSTVLILMEKCLKEICYQSVHCRVNLEVR